MQGLGFPDQKLQRPSIRARDDSPDSVIISSTRESSNFSSLFSSASGSVVDRCSFGSDIHDPDSLLCELSKHLSGRDLHRESSCGPDLSSVPKNSKPIKDRDKATEVEGEDDEKEAENPSKNSFSQALKECQNRRFRSEALPKKHERRRPASLDLNGRGADAVSSSPRFAAAAAMKKAPAPSSRRTGTFPSPGTPNYRGTGSGPGFQKGWSSERVPLPTNCSRRYANAIPLPFNNGRSLPSKWEDAEKWIFSPGDGASRHAVMPPPHRRPKSKSGPLGTPGMACYASPSMMVPMFDGGRVGNFVGSSPFSAGVLGADALSGRGCCGSGGAGSYTAHMEPCIARSVSIHGWSELLIESSLPSSQDEKVDGTKDAGTMISPVVSRRDMATQMSPESSSRSSPQERPSFSHSPALVLPIEELQNHHSPKQEIRDVQVDDRVTVTRWSKKDGIRGISKGSVNIGEWKKKAVEARASAWEVAETEKRISKFKREEAKITAWENLQKAKAEAEIRKLEMKLEKIRTSSMDKIMNKLRAAQSKAQGMRSSVSASQAHQVARTTEKASSFRKAGQMSSLSGCFTCHAF
ncbi:uncharacterized protein LOC131236415 [Magnolia sinica]|uniref:uncharacterized protein LOC131236415 n=1 Tax=Magnolia sinica TaxID=86752 RepID=UPI002657DACF|nr:uncharacterized protein LOC131236415 [Magnolia sinica]